MRILITGGAGCLGSNLIEEWLPKGHTILTIDNFATGRQEVLSSIPGIKVVCGTIADKALIDGYSKNLNLIMLSIVPRHIRIH